MLVAPDAVSELRGLAAKDRSRGSSANYDGPSDLEGMFIAIAATDDTDLNIRVFNDAEAPRDARQRCRRPAAVQFHPPGIWQRPARGRDLDGRRVAGPREADEARDRGRVR